jgi:DNA-binding transcriptional ArsR family regulator
MTNIDLFNALGEPTRRKLFERIRQGPCTVTELVATVTVSQPAVSQHLKVLREAQLVQVKKQGQQRIYQLNPKGLEEMRRYIEDLWDDALRAFADEAEKMANAAENTDIEISE